MGQRDEARRIWREAAQPRRRQRRAARNAGPAEGRSRCGAARWLLAALAAGRLRRRAAGTAGARKRWRGRLALQVDAGRTGRRSRSAPASTCAATPSRRAAAEHAAGHDAGRGPLGARARRGWSRRRANSASTTWTRCRARPSAKRCRWRALPDWLRGRPWPGAAEPARPLQPGPGFEQLGWTIDLARFDAGQLAGLARRPARRCALRAQLDPSP